SIVPAAAPWKVKWAEACHERAADCAVPETKRSRVHATPERSALVMLRAVPAENVPPRKPLPDDNVNSYARAKTSAAASVAAAAARKSAVVPWLPAAGVAGITSSSVRANDGTRCIAGTREAQPSSIRSVSVKRCTIADAHPL